MGSVSFNTIVLYLLTGLFAGGGGGVVFFCFLSDYTEFCFVACVKVQISADFCGVFAQWRQHRNAQVERFSFCAASINKLISSLSCVYLQQISHCASRWCHAV